MYKTGTIVDIFLIFLLAASFKLTSSVTKEFCNLSKLNLTCPVNEVIMIKTARFGRMQVKSACIKVNIRGYEGCHVNVVSFMDSRCSGKQSCEFQLPQHEMYTNYEPVSGVEKCSSDVTPYLEVEHTCTKVLPQPNLICRHSKFIEVPYGTGYLSSHTAIRTGLGTQKCPWKIQAKAGQVINITAYNFNRRTTYNTGSDSCMMYGQIKEDGRLKTSISLCVGDQRIKHLYTSTTAVVSIEFYNTMNSHGKQILIKYEATGCPDIQPQPGQDIKRSGDTAVITCHREGSPEIFDLTCKGTQWFGQKNCSVTGNDNSRTTSIGLFHTSNNFPYGLVIVVAIGVALGIFLGGVLLLCVSFYMKRKSQQNGDYARPNYDIEYNIQGENCPYPQMTHSQGCPTPIGNTDTLIPGMRCAKHGIPPDDMTNPDNTLTVAPMHNVPYKTERLYGLKTNTNTRDHLYEHPKP